MFPERSAQQEEPNKPDPRAEALAERERLQAERVNQAKALKADYYKVKDEPAFVDLLAKAKAFVEMHTAVAKDAVGYENERDADGNTRAVVTRLEPHERLRELDKAAGIQELVDYMERQISL